MQHKIIIINRNGRVDQEYLDLTPKMIKCLSAEKDINHYYFPLNAWIFTPRQYLIKLALTDKNNN